MRYEIIEMGMLALVLLHLDKMLSSLHLCPRNWESKQREFAEARVRHLNIYM